jgi:lipoprotein-releasing system ATP-binding protein
MTARLAARGVSFGYDPRRAVVEEWSEAFDAGSMTAITGPSGCGKSTRMYLLALMLRLGAGQVELDGARVDNLHDAARARLRAHRFGFVFQDAALDPTRVVLDNVLESSLYRGIARRSWEARALALLEEMGVTVPVSRRPGQISGGQAQRIALCRALVGTPDVVFADEPTGNLDPTSAAAVLRMLQLHAQGGGCVILVTHDPQVAAMCDRRLDLPEGPRG